MSNFAGKVFPMNIFCSFTYICSIIRRANIKNNKNDAFDEQSCVSSPHLARARARAREMLAHKRDVLSSRTSQKHEFELAREAQIEDFCYFLKLTVSTGRSFKANR